MFAIPLVRYFWWIVLLGLIAPVQASAETFPRYPSLEPAVAFWTAVFGRQSEHTTVIHVAANPGVVLQRLDFEPGLDNTVRRNRERAALAEMQQQLQALHRALQTGKTLSAVEQGLLARFDNASPAQIAAAAKDLRTQRGVRERTERAMQVSGRYMPMMEETFTRHALPVQLTRLPFVESSFNIEAYSKVGAAGLWQFMPGTARRYLRLDDARDDRRDPWLSTDGAARHLRDDYALLGNWPLAVTAYNHGRYGLKRGLEQTGGKTLVDLIDRYEHRNFGFASKNFYAEFLAVKDIEADRTRYFPNITRSAPVEFVEITLGDYVPYSALKRLGNVDEALFVALNPGFTPAVRSDQLWVPKGSTIRVPVQQAPTFSAHYDALPDGLRHAAQREYWRHYKVPTGRALSQIARQHGVTVAAIQSANNLRNPNQIRAGQTLRIPPAAGRYVVASARNSVHVVRSGQTLTGIARQHGVSIQAIVAANTLANRHQLRPGQKLTIPSGA